jgi:hypothetical protein
MGNVFKAQAAAHGASSLWNCSARVLLAGLQDMRIGADVPYYIISKILLRLSMVEFELACLAPLIAEFHWSCIMAGFQSFRIEPDKVCPVDWQGQIIWKSVPVMRCS